MIFHYDRKLPLLRFPTMNWHCLAFVALQDIVGLARSFIIFQKIIFSLRIMLFLIIFFELVAYCLPAERQRWKEWKLKDHLRLLA